MRITRNIPAWQMERAAILHRICKGVDARLARRRGLLRAVGASARRWKGRRYRFDSSKRVRLSRKTLAAQYRQWRDAGKIPEVFQLHYRPNGPKIPTRLVAEFIRVCGAPGVHSMSAAYRQLAAMWRAGELKRPFAFRRRAELPFSRNTFCRALSREQRRVIIRAQRTERAATLARAQYKRITEFD